MDKMGLSYVNASEETKMILDDVLLGTRSLSSKFKADFPFFGKYIDVNVGDYEEYLPKELNIETKDKFYKSFYNIAKDSGLEVSFFDDTCETISNIACVKDQEGNEVHYRRGVDTLSRMLCGSIPAYSYLIGEAPIIDYIKDKDGNVGYYSDPRSSNKKQRLDYIRDKEGKEFHLQRDGKLAWTKDKDGNEVHYKRDGKTVHHTISKDGEWKFADGIKDNIIAQKRRYLAEKMGLKNVKTPKKYRQFEAFMAEKISKNK